MRKICFLDTDTVGEVSLEPIAALGELTTYPTTFPDQTVGRLQGIEIAITNKVRIGRTEMDALPDLKLIAVAATGTNNIDLEAANEKGIQVKNVKGYSTISVAQFTLGQVLSMMHPIKTYDQFVKSGAYSRGTIFTYVEEPYQTLEGKIWGIIGMGEIGQKVAQLAQCLGAKVVYYSTSGKNTQAGYPSVSFEDLLKTADIVSIHCPLNAQTAGLVDAKALALLKRSAILVNVARGGIVDERALVEALNQNVLAGAIVDVFSEEPISENNPLLQCKFPEKVLLSPHVAWAGLQARQRLIEGIAKNIKEFYMKS